MTTTEDETIAGHQRANAALRQERDTARADRAAALAREAALAEVLNVINRSPGDTAPVFAVILEKAHSLCGADLGALSIYDGTQVRSVATLGYSEQAAALVRLVAGPSPIQQALIGGERCIHIPDVRAIEFAPGLDISRRIVEMTGLRTYLIIPLRKDGTLLGHIAAHRLEVCPFVEHEIALLESFAVQAVIAMENARLLSELRERTAALAERNSEYGERIEQQSATIDVLRVMSASPGDPQPVFNLIVERARVFCGADHISLELLDDDTLGLAAYASTSEAWMREYRDSFPKPLSTASIMGRAILMRASAQIVDIFDDPEYGRKALGAWARSTVAVPLLRGGAAIGAIGIGRSVPGEFATAQMELLWTFAEQAVIAISSAEMYRKLNQRTADLQESLEYQTATSDVLKVISRSTFDLQPVFQAVAATAVRLCHADQAGIYLHEHGEYRWASGYSQLPEYERIEREVIIRPSTGTLVGRVALEGGPVHILDACTDTLYEAKEDARVGAVHTLLGVPLLRDGSPIGVIGLGRQRIEAFTDRQIELVNTFAAQAVIAMENARLITEQREALEQQTATAEVLQVINASPGNLAPVFDTMLENALRLCGAAFGILLTFDGERFHHTAFRSIPAAYVEFMREHPPIYGPENAPGRLALGERLVHVLDITDTDAYRSGDANRRAIADLAGARTLVAVPLQKDSALVGAIVVFRQEVRPFTDRQIALLENFAAQAVIAIENTRLITEQREALEQQTATAEVLQVINASPGDLAPVFETILEKAHSLCDIAQGSLELYDGARFRAVAVRGMPDAFAEMLRLGYPASDNPATRPLIEGSRFSHIRDLAETDYSITQSGVELAACRTLLCVPLRRDNTVLGMIASARREVRPFSDKEIALLENFAAQAVIAMENARLLNEVRQRQEELRITFENMGDGVAMFDGTPRLVTWNRKFQDIMDLPSGVLAARPTFPDYIRYLAERGEYGSETDPEEEIRNRVAEASRYRANERVRPDGRVIEIRQVPVAGGGFVMVLADITERKRNEAEIHAARDAAQEASRTIEAAYRDLKAAQANLIQAEKMASLGQLTAGIAHEIKNPLNFVNNFAALSVDLLSELKEASAPGFAALTDDQRAEIDDVSAMLTSNLEKITEHGKRADGIVKAMLEHSRGSSAERRMVDLNAVIDEALNLAYHGARAQDQSFNITLERDFGSDIAPIEVNPQDMTRVFLNIFSNGFYAATRRARSGGGAGFMPMLKVTTRDSGEVVEIRVRDNGTGIPAESRDKLFQPFFTTKPTGEGTGLGLSITYDIITKQHGGTITVESEVEAFTEFVVTLPRQMFATDGDRA